MLLITLGCVYLSELLFSFTLDIYSGVELLDNMLVLFSVFWGTYVLFSTVDIPIYIFTNHVLGRRGWHPTPIFLAWRIHMDRGAWWVTVHGVTKSDLVEWLSIHTQSSWEVWSDISLWFQFVFLWWLVMLNIFSSAYWPSVCLLWENIYLGFLPIF